MHEIEKLRSEIDEIHIELTGLLKKRLALTHQIWQIKKAQQTSFVDPKREEQIFRALEKSTEDEAEKLVLKNVFTLLLSETKIYLGKKLK